jgi:hypothetical protein
MTFTAALVKEQGQTFAVVLVKHPVLRASNKENVREGFRSGFPGVPIILCGQDASGCPTYDGRRDIVNFLANVDFRRLPWSEWGPAGV